MVLQFAMKDDQTRFVEPYNHLRQPRYKRRLPLEKRSTIIEAQVGTEGLLTSNHASCAAGFVKAEHTVDVDSLERHLWSSECDLGISCEVEGAVAQGGAQALENELLAELHLGLRQVSESPTLEIDLLACQLSIGQQAQLCDRADFGHLQADFGHLQACSTIGRP